MKALLKTEINVVQELKLAKEATKQAKKIEDELKKQVLNLMDLNLVDAIKIGGYKAERKLIIQSRLDTKKAKELLGDKAPMNEVEMIKLTVI